MDTGDLPAEHATELSPLGEPIAEFRARGGKLLLLYIGCALGFILGGIGLLVGAGMVIAAMVGEGKAGQLLRAGGRLLVFGAMILSGGFGCLKVIRGTKGLRIIVFNGGL